jgi:hypothetical protein
MRGNDKQAKAMSTMTPLSVGGLQKTLKIQEEGTTWAKWKGGARESDKAQPIQPE